MKGKHFSHNNQLMVKSEVFLTLLLEKNNTLLRELGHLYNKLQSYHNWSNPEQGKH